MSKQKVPIEMAKLIAEGIIKRLAPHAERMEIAGSIRRGKPEVGDIEILYIPRMGQSGQASLFTGAGEVREDLVGRELRRMMEEGLFEKRMNALGRPIGYGSANKALVHTHTGVGVDVFSATARNWGMAMVVRTGPADWNQEMMGAFLRLGMQGHAYGGVTKNGAEVECPTEGSVFALLGLPYLPPNERTPEALRLVHR